MPSNAFAGVRLDDWPLDRRLLTVSLVAVSSVKYVPDWFPGAQLKREGGKWQPLAQATTWLPFQSVKRRKVSFFLPNVDGT